MNIFCNSSKQIYILIFFQLCLKFIFAQNESNKINENYLPKYTLKPSNKETKYFFNNIAIENDKKTFDLLHRPSTTNELAKLFSSQLTQQEIESVRYINSYPNIWGSIRASIEIKDSEFYIEIDTGFNSLNLKIRQILKRFLRDKFNKLDEFKYKRILLQIFKFKNKKASIELSSVFVVDELPYYKNESKENEPLKSHLTNLITEKIDFRDAEYNLTRSGIYLKAEFTLSKNGKVSNFLVKGKKTSKLRGVIIEIGKNLNAENIIPLHRNKIPITSKITFPIYLTVKKKKYDFETIKRLTNNLITEKTLGFIEKDSSQANKKNDEWEKTSVRFTFNKNYEIANVWNQDRLANSFSTNWNTSMLTVLKAIFKKDFLKKINLNPTIDKIYNLECFYNGLEVRFMFNGSIKNASIGYYSDCKKCKNIYDLVKHNSNEVNKFILDLIKKEFKEYNISLIKSKKYRFSERELETNKKSNSEFTINYIPKQIYKGSNNENEEPLLFHIFFSDKGEIIRNAVYKNLTDTPEELNFSKLTKLAKVNYRERILSLQIDSLLKNKIIYKYPPKINNEKAHLYLSPINLLVKKR